jgi:hypothetical protein
MHYMILMSKKMTSQKKLGEIKSVHIKPLVFEMGWFDGSILSALVKKITRATPSTRRVNFFDPPHFYCTYRLFGGSG